MLINNPNGLIALTKREIMRFISVSSQTLVPPLVSTALFICIFGLALGRQINLEHANVSYLAFLIPGLITMQAITSSYENASSSLFIARWHNHIQEVLLSPLSYFEMVLGILIGSVTRSLLVITGVLVISSFFHPMHVQHPLLFLYFALIIPVIFSSCGMLAALWAEDFNMLTIWNTYIIMPCTFLGGVFHPVHLIPKKFQIFTRFNPFYYLVDGLRFSILGLSDANIYLSIAISFFLALTFFSLTVYLFKIGYKLRT